MISRYNDCVRCITHSSSSRGRGEVLTSWRNFFKSAGGMLKLFVPASGHALNSEVCSLIELYFLEWNKAEGIDLLLGIERKQTSESFTGFVLLLLVLFFKLLNKICHTSET